jgi:hypothetical protein
LSVEITIEGSEMRLHFESSLRSSRRGAVAAMISVPSGVRA